MKLTLRVIPNARRNRLEGGRVYLTAPPVEGKANAALVEFLAEHYGVKRRQVRMIRGAKSRDKVIEIEGV